jgi:hypothetical protein
LCDDDESASGLSDKFCNKFRDQFAVIGNRFLTKRQIDLITIKSNGLFEQYDFINVKLILQLSNQSDAL